MGYGATPQGQGQQVAHPMPSQWNQGNPGVPATQELPLSQGSMQIPPGQSGASQHSLGMSQQTVATTPSWYSPPGPQPVPPRPRVQGMGLAGMMPTFPPPPPSWDPHHATGHFRAPGNLHGSPAPPATTPSPTSVRTTPRTSPAGGPTKTARIPNIPMGQHWKQDEENYDNQKVNGLILPRTIRASSWTQLDSAQGHRRMRPLTVPLSKLFYQGSENFWLRKLATGREVYVATMGEVNQVVFVSEILSQIRSRGLDLDRLAQHKALQDGHTLEKKEAIQYITKLLGGDPLLNLTQAPNTRLLNYKLKLLLWKLQQTKLRTKIHQLRVDQVHQIQIDCSHPLKQPSKDNDLWLLILLNFWLLQAVLTSGWKQHPGVLQ